jgi:antitoxin HicB
MKTYRYAAVLEPGQERGFCVTFPDLPEAITQGDNRTDALFLAQEVLGLALLDYLADRRPLPAAIAERGGGVVMVSPHPEVAAKLALIEAFQASGLTQAELATRIGREGRETRRLLDPDHPSKLPALSRALQALGKRLIISVDDAA